MTYDDDGHSTRYPLLLQGGRYRLAFAGAEGEYRSPILPGFWLRTEWLWQRPLPPVLTVMRELGLI